MAAVANAYCERLGISVPSLAATRAHPQANTYALLIVALLEHGRPMTLDEVARRFEAAGVACADDAYAALKRCRPARPPVFRDGELYALDPRDDELDLWVFRLGLRPPRVPRREPPPPPPRPPASQRLGVDELDVQLRRDLDHRWLPRPDRIIRATSAGRATGLATRGLVARGTREPSWRRRTGHLPRST
jgi:hypothetical protein